MEKYLDENTRIVLKRMLLSGYVIALQRKVGKRWKIVSTVYPSLIKGETLESVVEILKYFKERSKTEKQIGTEIIEGFLEEDRIRYENTRRD